MDIIEKRKKIESCIEALKRLKANSTGSDKDEIDYSITKLEVQKETIVGSEWDKFTMNITLRNIQELIAIKESLDQVTANEKEKTEKVKKGIEIARKIYSFLK